LPIFDQNQAQIARARFVLEQAIYWLRALETEIMYEVRSAADQAKTARKIALFYETQVLPQSQRNLDMARDAYRAGKTGFLSVLEAERTLLAARDRHASAQQEALVSLARLERVVGAPIGDASAAPEFKPDASPLTPTDATPAADDVLSSAIRIGLSKEAESIKLVDAY
jgi:outer membrane protein TolC